MIKPKIGELWGESLIAFEGYHHLISQLLTDYRPELVPWLEKVLFSRRDMPLALVIVEKLNTDEKQRLFSSLVQLASKTVPHTGTVRNIISALPRDWVLRHVEDVTADILNGADSEECRRILELYSELDKGLLQNLCEQIIASGTADFQEVARDFMD
ncbi:MAG: hypothetical protein JO356_05865 [Acidobacteria bacterium]|nr:hypothetical protein [Acidobacteriota bacterium]